jgi:non-ribosomal peptide synthetase component F
LPVQYADWAGWQAEQLTVARRAALVQWWRGELAGAPVRLELPRPRAQAGAPRGRRLHRRLDRAAMASLAAFATAERQTAFGALAAVCGAVLARCTGQDRLLLGVAVAHRDRPEVEHVLGLFVDSVALRVDLTGDPRFAELVRRVASAMAAAYDHRDLPFDQLVAAIDPPGPPEPSRRRDRSPGIQVHFAHHPAGSIGCIALHGCTVTERVVDASTAKFELMLRVEQVADGAVLWAEFDSAQIEPAWAERLLVDYAELLGAAVCHPDRRLSELPPRAR